VTMYQVEVIREQRKFFYVENSTREAARLDAEELIDSPDAGPWQLDDDDIIMVAARVPSGETFWTGGPHGDWKTAT
jgi:hypothetical protein